MRALGFDFGSVCSKGVLLDPDGSAALSFYAKKGLEDGRRIDDFLNEVGQRCPGEVFRIGVSGLGVPAAVAAGVSAANGIVAVATGVRHLCPAARSIIEIGGHTSKLIELRPAAGPMQVHSFTTNEACAAGTGSFLEQQARRLGLSVSDLAELGTTAARHATIAGRCAVFAKSDMIHLQQKGTPVEEIAYGLSMAICRNALAVLLRGRELEPPVAIAGGCARNASILRAFREVLDPAAVGSLITSPCPGLEGALGAALVAADEGGTGLDLAAVRAALGGLLTTARQARREALPPLVRPTTPGPCPEPIGAPTVPMEGFLGIDLGSVSTDFAVLGLDGGLISSVYLPTRGRPVDVLREGLAILRERFRHGLRVRGCGTTGSGRHLAAKLLGGDVVKNEITCQLLGAQHSFPEVDTIFEIGGQDSKFISARHGRLSDFVMNKICAAGTGSFLEEQARELGIDIYTDFAPQAFAAGRAEDLGSRCTVFMETEVINALHHEAPVGEICAGLACAVVRNYLDKVVGKRPLGECIVFQGGVASNPAVVAAFTQVLGRPVHVHPYNRLSGAIGAALAARQAMAPQSVSRFRGFDTGPAPALRSFECRQCANHCEVSVIETGSERICFGDTCERYTSHGAAERREPELPNLAAEYLAQCRAYFDPAAAGRLTVGVPCASTLLGNLPFWGTFFRRLGLRVVLSADSSQETLTLGLRHLPVGACLPIKLTAGHANALLEQDVDFVFLPAMVRLPGDDPCRSYACPYAMAVPYMIRTRRRQNVLSPVISLTDGGTFIDSFESCRRALGASHRDVMTAFRAATAAQAEAEERLTQRLQAGLDAGGYRYVVTVLGKPYAMLDAYINLNLFERLRRLGILALPLNRLPPASAAGRDTIACDLPWRFCADIARAAVAAAAAEGVYPIIMSSFGCGPDAFTFRQVEAALKHKPHLFLEFDEHRGEAGLITRLEAFIDQLDGLEQPPAAAAALPVPVPVRRPAQFPSRSAAVRIPYFSDQAYAYSGLWKHRGNPVQVLPRPTPAVRALGDAHTLGKECHAYSLIVGDLLHLHRTDGHRELVYYVPRTSIPCLLHEYGNSLQLLVQEEGIRNVRVCCPTGEEVVAEFGIEGAERIYMGLLATELLVKAMCGIRPYETEKGRTDAVHQRNLERIEAAVADGDVLKALDEALRELAAIPVERTCRRPLVGIAGDVYTKANPAANSDLYRWLEEQGLEVWPSPFQVDMLDFGLSRRLLQSASALDLPELLLSSSLMLKKVIDAWRVQNVVGGRIPRAEEPGYLELRRLAGPYMPNEQHVLLFLNIAKIVDFARNGADGIINAMCFNCMVGTASAAVIERVRADYHDIPIVTAVYAGGDDPSRRMVLDAFVSQVKAYHATRSGRAGPTVAARTHGPP